jgi:hypothetical protein
VFDNTNTTRNEPMRKTMMVWSACAAAALSAIAASTAAADAVPYQDVGQAAINGQSADSAATSTQANPTNQAIHVAILSPGAATGAVSQSNTSVAQSAAGNHADTTQNAAQSGGGAGGVQAVGQAAASRQAALSAATSTQANPTNQAIDVAILSPGAGSGSGAVSQSNDSAAQSAAGNHDDTTQNAAQSGGGGGGGGGVQAVGQQAGNEQGAGSTATSTQSGASDKAIHVAILSPGASSGAVSQSNDSAARSEAGNENATKQNAVQDGGGGGGGAGGYEPVKKDDSGQQCGSCHAPSSPAVQGIGQAADNHQWAGSSATSTQESPSNVAIDLAILSPGAYGGPVSQSNDSKAQSAAGNHDDTTQNAAQSAGGWGGGVQAIGQLATSAQSALSAATSTQWCPSNLALGTGGDVKQSNASAAGSAAGNENRTTQYAQQALAAFPGPVVLM